MASTRAKPSCGEALDQCALGLGRHEVGFVLQPVAGKAFAQDDLAHACRSRLSACCLELEFLDRMLAQGVLLHLAARRHADGVEARHDRQVAWHPEIGAALAHKRDQFALGRGGLGLERDERGAHLAEPRIGNADDLRGRDGGMREQHLLDLGRGDVLAAHPEGVLDAPDHAQPALGRENADVAGAQPAVGREGLGGRFRVLVVAAHDVPAAHLNLAGFTGRQHGTGVTPRDAHLDSVMRLCEAGDPQVARIAMIVEHHVGRGFRQSISDADLACAHFFDDVADGFRTRRRPAAAQTQQRRVEARMAHHELEQRVVPRGQRAAFPGHHVERGPGLERRQRDQAGACDQRDQERERRAGDMEERPAIEIAVVRRDPHSLAHGPGIAQHVVVGEHHSLGIGCRARGELDQQQVARPHLADTAIEHVIRQAVAQREKCIEADRRRRHLAADDHDMMQQRQRATRERMVESGLGRAQE